MNWLLDTHVLLWALTGSDKLKPDIRSQLEDSKRAVFVSAVSVWEIAIKQAIGKLDVPERLEDVLHATHFSPLSISWAHARASGELPLHHQDPFDRMLVAQAMAEGLTLVTHDRHLKRYGSFVHLI